LVVVLQEGEPRLHPQPPAAVCCEPSTSLCNSLWSCVAFVLPNHWQQTINDKEALLGAQQPTAATPPADEAHEQL
jgi:hypothetical protein